MLALKGNHEQLHAAVGEYFDELHEDDFEGGDCRRQTKEKARGRVEWRYYYQAPLPEKLKHFAEERPGLTTIGQATSITEREGKECADVHYYLGSLKPGVKRFARAARSHWGIENCLH